VWLPTASCTPAPENSFASTTSVAPVAFVRIRLVRNLPSSRTAAIDRAVPLFRRSASEDAGTLCPKVPPPGPGVDVSARMLSEAVGELIRIAPYPDERPKAPPRTSS
jgi:hypothetical protein